MAQDALEKGFLSELEARPEVRGTQTAGKWFPDTLGRENPDRVPLLQVPAQLTGREKIFRMFKSSSPLFSQ